MKKGIAFLLMICMLLSVAACAPQNEAPAATDAPAAAATDAPAAQPAETEAPATDAPAAETEPLRIAFANTIPGLFQTMIEESIKAYCNEKGYEFTVTYSNGDSTKTLSDVQTFINAEQDYVLCYVLDEGTQESIRQMAENTDTKVVFMGLELEGYTTISGGNYNGAHNTGKKLWEAVQSRWGGEFDTFIVIEATSYGAVNTERTSGVLDSFCELSGMDPADAVRLDYDDVLKAQSAFATALTAHPDSERIVVYGVTDANQTIGAWNAACAAGREEQLIISGAHVADEATPGLMTNHPEIWIGQSDLLGNGYGEAFVQFIEGFEAGEDLTGVTIPMEQTWVDASNVADYYTVK